ncbi:ammonium transporter 1 [Pyronema omphalodes]|nr:ammonium transporter 1 [Pyronema omphalodes]
MDLTSLIKNSRRAGAGAGAVDNKNEPYDSQADGGGVYYEAGNISFLLLCTALVLLMIPGVGFFYSGLARRKSALSLIWLSLMSIAVVGFQWFLWGYSLAFSHTAGRFIGNLDNFAWIGVLDKPSVVSRNVPDLLFAVYEGMFACITVSLTLGATAERGRILPAITFMFLFSTLIYDPIACWTWNPSGWSYRLGGLDFAGGTPVHISSGSAALAYSLMLGPRLGHGTSSLNYRPHNVTHIVLGTVMMWVGWLGFNGGSAMGANLRAVVAVANTILAAGMGGGCWVLLDYRLEGKWSVVGFCSGVVAGLVAITPGSGFVPTWAALVYGIVGGAACNYATKLKFGIGVDDALDIFAEHAVGGVVGNVLTGFFAANYIPSLDPTAPKIQGGWLNHNWIQPLYQLADSLAGMSYSFLGSCVILFCINMIPGLSLRTDQEAEVLGVDDTELGEFAYDYVELAREVCTGVEMEGGGEEEEEGGYGGGRMGSATGMGSTVGMEGLRGKGDELQLRNLPQQRGKGVHEDGDADMHMNIVGEPEPRPHDKI